ncbi:hypothetical protein [Paraliomyxa miuraensis]|uniref:hypothetical protein n=1 Tax=Paraliomyxa miuraensis TaxID=376150 RepID=UPI002259E7FA|nr:hypothetical protein [Paraliomyxa miuraensis]MCX4239243.1 hypothetical protein [Paraliomyxa miuraensis]
MPDALAHVVSAAGRVLEDRLTLWTLELRHDVERRLRIGMLRVAVLATSTCAVGLGTAAMIWSLSRVMSIGLSLLLVASGFGAAAAGLRIVARRAARVDEPRALAPGARTAALTQRGEA